ncbi:metalloregulator ArsR/SmtB family transcription factor [Limnobaculum zhutongyuii]|uniref:Arsenical resistance operon repressor n=1 Tax=Limnobaculum zhutongyuii TaxID=2498113 RepID=A0A411WJF7_9GAMM|nr:metalloregulator ArsR/SmtB family transcription factor [Limnobaculum zhutongyuii]QBH96307.1 metalloregulator ArsR/SmtB family transcription factor [Limnobaculum zhutongyuii]TQS87104.1 ArsR family transcriptional regulator [Limnobaculum zhutongyuii]
MGSLTPLQLFKTLSDETRLTIVLLLKDSHELCVCELCEILKLPQPKISRHLAMLRETGILLDRREGKWIHYRLSPNIPLWAGNIIEQAFSSELNQIKAVRYSVLTESKQTRCR